MRILYILLYHFITLSKPYVNNSVVCKKTHINIHYGGIKLKIKMHIHLFIFLL